MLVFITRLPVVLLPAYFLSNWTWHQSKPRGKEGKRSSERVTPSSYSIFFVTALNTTPQPLLVPSHPQVNIPQGFTDGIQQELDKVTANEGLIRTAVTVLQHSMHNLGAVTNKLNVDLISQRHRLDRLGTRVSEYSKF